jgi:hypothetical protein
LGTEAAKQAAQAVQGAYKELQNAVNKVKTLASAA